MKEERSSDSELSFAAERSPEGSGTAKNVFITAAGRDATELKDYRDVMAAAKTVN